MELSKNFGKLPWQRKRYRVEGDPKGIYAGLRYDYRDQQKAVDALKQMCLNCVLENQQAALLGQSNQPSLWQLRDLETGKVLEALKAGSYKPVAPDRAVRNLAKLTGVRV